MDVTALARSLLGPVPAHGTAGLEVLRAAGGAAEVALLTQPALTSVIGSLHSSGLDHAGRRGRPGGHHRRLRGGGEMRGVLPLGAAATLEFRAPAHGRLVASCRLAETAREARGRC
jgi:hypothetical protein